MRRLVVLAVLVAGACSSSRPAPVLDRGSVVAAQAAPQSAPQGGAQAPRSPVRSGAASGTGTASNAGPSAAQAAPAVQVNPVAGVGSIESRPIESRPAAARGNSPALAVSPGPAAPAGGPGTGSADRSAATVADAATAVKSEPRGYKLPWSEENLALMQGATRQAPETAAPEAGAAVARPVDPRPVVARPAPEPVAERPEFAWPVKGRLIERFEAGSRGIAIAANEGDPVLAAAGGTVLYAGAGIRGYGQLLIVKHNDSFISEYAHNSRLQVKQGDVVRSAQKIAEVGHTDANRPKLHFEIRRQGTSIDPLQYLPARD